MFVCLGGKREGVCVCVWKREWQCMCVCRWDSVCVDAWMCMCVCMCVEVSAYLCQSKQFGLLSHTFTKEANFDRLDQQKPLLSLNSVVVTVHCTGGTNDHYHHYCWQFYYYFHCLYLVHLVRNLFCYLCLRVIGFAADPDVHDALQIFTVKWHHQDVAAHRHMFYIHITCTNVHCASTTRIYISTHREYRIFIPLQDITVSSCTTTNCMEKENAKTLILRDSNIWSILTYLTARPCFITNTKRTNE